MRTKKVEVLFAAYDFLKDQLISSKAFTEHLFVVATVKCLYDGHLASYVLFVFHPFKQKKRSEAL